MSGKMSKENFGIFFLGKDIGIFWKSMLYYSKGDFSCAV